MKATFKFTGRTGGFGGAALALAVLLGGCAGAGALEPDARDARWAEGRWPGTTVASLQGGRTLFVSKCGACHQLPDPGVKTPDEWASVIGEMAPRAKLSDDDRESVLRYLSAASEREHSGTVTLASSGHPGG